MLAAMSALLALTAVPGNPAAAGQGSTAAARVAVGGESGSPAQYPVGSRALIDVSVATLWREPGIHRRIDRPSLRNPVAVNRWNRNLRTADQRRWLVGNVQTQALYGQEVVVRQRSGSWVKVAVIDEPEPQDPAGYPGWLPARQLRHKAGYPTVTDTSDYVVVLVPRTRVRLGDGASPPTRRSVRIGYGTRLPMAPAVGDPDGAAEQQGGAAEQQGGTADPGWVDVMTPDGPGRVPAASVGPPKPPSAASILADGRRFLRLRYLWGGLSAWGMDCSGIIWNLFRAHGRTIPRDADPQFRSGRRVALDRLQPGDFLFWGTQRYVHHVALYVGRGQMLEAPNSAGRVQIVPVRWDGLVGARRYLG